MKRPERNDTGTEPRRRYPPALSLHRPFIAAIIVPGPTETPQQSHRNLSYYRGLTIDNYAEATDDIETTLQFRIKIWLRIRIQLSNSAMER